MSEAAVWSREAPAGPDVHPLQGRRVLLLAMLSLVLGLSVSMFMYLEGARALPALTNPTTGKEEEIRLAQESVLLRHFDVLVVRIFIPIALGAAGCLGGMGVG